MSDDGFPPPPPPPPPAPASAQLSSDSPADPERRHGPRALVPRSLRARLVTTIVLALALGLGVTGVSTLALLSGTLVEEVDAQLTRAAGPLADAAFSNLRGMPGLGQSAGLPSDYYVEFITADGLASTPWWSRPGNVPLDLPQITLLTVEQTLERGGEPFTAYAKDGTTRWRVVVLATRDLTGSVAIALPLTAADATMAQMRAVLLVVSLVVVVAGGLAATWAVRRSLRPLRQIEQTAAAIAAGDLAQRVPNADERTEVGHLATSLNAMLGNLEQAFEEREASEQRMRRFVADASHELRTPLATVRGYAELHRLGAVTSPEQAKDSLLRIEQSATRMGTLVEDLLSLARLDSARELRRDLVDLTLIATEATSDLVALDPSRSVRLVPLAGAGETEPVLVVGDPDRLRQVVTNLVGNAVAHTPAGTAVEIAVGLDGDDRAALEVRDHGPGISPEHAARVFERFYRADASRGRASGGGAGLGMSIVQTIIALHDGEVTLRETPGGGATVRITLPSRPADRA